MSVLRFRLTGLLVAGLGTAAFADEMPLFAVTAPTALRCEYLENPLGIDYQDGSPSRVASDASWKAGAGPVRSLGGLRHGGGDFGVEVYDARREQPGWNQVGFDDSAWKPAVVLQPPPVACSAQMIAPNRVVSRLRTVAVSEPQPGRYLLDFGTNLTGRLRMKITSASGREIGFVYYTAPFRIHSGGGPAWSGACIVYPWNVYHSMVTQPTWPSYRQMIEQGATTLWEHWRAGDSSIHNSFTVIETCNNDGKSHDRQTRTPHGPPAGCFYVPFSARS